MKNYTKEEIKVILEKHKKWLNSEEGGERANLRYANLSSAELSYANLRYANLRSADLSDADLSDADLRHADLRSANLRSANLSFAELSSADLRHADLRSANLRSANLMFADLRSVDLRSVDLRVYLTSFYTVYVTSTKTRIGCKNFTNKEWREFEDRQIKAMDSNALEFWIENKTVIFAIMDQLENKYKEQNK